MVNTSTVSEPEIPPINPIVASHINRSRILLLSFIEILLLPLFFGLVCSNGSVVSSTISSIDVLGEELTNQKFGRLYRRWLKFANRTMKQSQKQVKTRSQPF
jgi:hypothetical protein